jgi:hypothetical protein
MTKTKIHFSLTGKTDQWKKYANSAEYFSNADNLNYVTDLIKLQFGERPMYFSNESVLRNDAVTYPRFFSAKWFVSVEDSITELVVVGHGESMEAADKAAISTMKSISWAELAKSIDD